MVKLIVIARCIPEEVYLAHADHVLPAAAGKKFSVVVREPESWYIGRLAIEIQNRYEALYKRSLGQIKYLKDAVDDCDLDPELTVSDLLVDEGKTLQDSSDQKRTVLVVVDEGRVIRQGSVIPDLTPLHYQPATKPPVPKFPGIEKRMPEEPELDKRPPKRRRLDQIEDDDGEGIARSIEDRTGINGRGRRSPSHFEVPGAHFLSALNTGSVDQAALGIKRESPGPQFWPNTTPATRDELELLPQQPENWQPHLRSGDASASHLRSDSFNQESRRQSSRQSALMPTTPGTNNQVRQSSSANTIDVLNGLKSVSPALRRPSSSSAGRFRASKKNVYDILESDVEDSQMSPESKTGRKPITPKLVQTSRSTDTNPAAKKTYRTPLLKRPVVEERLTVPESTHYESILLPDGTDAMDHEDPHNQESADQDIQLSNEVSWERDGFSKIAKPASHHEQGDPEALEAEEQNRVQSSSKDSASDGEDSTSNEAASSKEGKSSSGVASTSRSSSVASSASGSGQSSLSKSARKKASYAQDRKTMTENEDDETLDSPGVQLEENLRQSSPVRRKSAESRSLTSASKDSVLAEGDRGLPTSIQDDDNQGDVARPPESVSDYEEAVQSLKPRSRTKRSQPSKASRTSKADASAAEELRCYTCWVKRSICDNAKPKCSYCSKWKKTCQIYDMTKEDADQEKEDRKQAKTSKLTTGPTPQRKTSFTRKALDAQISDEVVSASDGDDDDADDSSNKKQSKDSQGKVSKPKAEPSRQKKKVEKKNLSEQSKEPLEQIMSMVENSGEKADAMFPKGKTPMQGSPKKLVSENAVPKSDVSQHSSDPVESATDNVEDAITPKAVSTADLDTHCSVISTSAQPCSRSLTCRLHSMTQKRAVPGRSQPFDALLKQQKAKKGATTTARGEKQMRDAGSIQQSEAITEPSKPAIVSAKSVNSASADVKSAKAPSVDSRAALSGRTIPPWLTEEEYDRLASERAGYIRPDSKEKPHSSRKSAGSHTETTPLVVRSQASQDSAQKTKKPTSSIKSDDKVTSSSQASSKRQRALATAQPEPNSHIFATATTSGPVNTLQPKTVPAKSSTDRQVAADARANGRLIQHPVKANTAATMNSDKHANPPYRQPLKKPLLSSISSAQDLGTVRSLKDLKATLKAGGSGTSTPQSQSVRDRLSEFNNSARSKQGFKLDDEEEDDEETESEDESPPKEEIKPKTPRFTAVNGIGNIHARPRQPSPIDDDDESEDSDDGTEW